MPNESAEHQIQMYPVKSAETRIAVILPVAYSGGSLVGAKLLAKAIHQGSKNAGQAAKVVFGHLDCPRTYPDEVFSDLPKEIQRRAYHWKVIDKDMAFCAMRFSHQSFVPTENAYQIPDDGMNQFLDCDMWIIVSDRLQFPLLPIKPYIVMVYDYLQRYEKFLSEALNNSFIAAAHRAKQVWVTTDFTRQDAIHYAGLPDNKILKLPMLIPDFSKAEKHAPVTDEPPYFIWPTNLAPHKNHLNAILALEQYYEIHNGELSCKITGVNSQLILDSELPYLTALTEVVNRSKKLKSKLQFLGELSTGAYQAALSNAEFLWHPAKIDNGTFSVVEAAQLGVPSLSSDYPAMHEMNKNFALQLKWMQAYSPMDMATQLKNMESNINRPDHFQNHYSPTQLQNSEKSASSYWEAIQSCL